MKMLKTLFFALGFIFATSALAGHHMPKGDFGWYGVTGNFKQITDTQIYWLGEFSGTFFADDTNSPLHGASMRCPGFMDVNLATQSSTLGGYCLISDQAGNKASVKWQGTGDGINSGGDWSWVSGDGPYADLAGKSGGKWRGKTVTNWADGAATGWAYWNK